MSNGYQSPVDRPGIIIGGAERGPQDYRIEQTGESELFASESTAADRARGIQDERKLWWSVGLGLLGSLFGPIGVPIGAAIGKIVGDMSTVGGKQAEDYVVSTDVGKYEKQQKFQLEEFNRNLKAYDKGQLWTDIMDIGTSAFSAWQLGGGSLKEGFTKFNPLSWKGKEGKLAPGSKLLEESWERLLGK